MRVKYNKELFFAKRDDCAALCTQNKECKSFEHCKNTQKCGLIDVDLPKTKDKCVKVNNTKVCTNFCILNKETKPFVDDISNDRIGYDYCKQDG